MTNGIIDRESYVISGSKIARVYGGRDEISSHIILAPAHELPIKRTVDNTNKSGPDGGRYFGDITECFTHFNLDIYRRSLEDSFREGVLLAIVSRGSSLLLRADSHLSVKLENDVCDSVFSEWAFDRRIGNGGHYLQIAHVNKAKKILDLPIEEIHHFLRTEPLKGLTSNRFGKGKRKNDESEESEESAI